MSGGGAYGKTWPPCGLSFLHHATVRLLELIYACSCRSPQPNGRSVKRLSERGSGKENIPTLSTLTLSEAPATKQQKTALNMAKFIQNQSLLLLEKLNELDLDAEADLCEKLHDDAEHLFRTLSSRLDELQDGN